MVIIFGSVRFLLKKITKLKYIFLKKKPKPGQTDRFRFGFGSVFFGFGSVFFGLARFWLGFSGLARFFRFRFGFLLIKPKPNRTDRFFQNFNMFNRFFFSIQFLSYFFSDFLNLINFSVFFRTTTFDIISNANHYDISLFSWKPQGTEK